MMTKKLTIVSLVFVGIILAIWAIWSPDHRAQLTGAEKTSDVAGGSSHPGASAQAEAFPEGFAIAQHQANLEEIAAEKDGVKRDHELKDLVDSIPLGDLPKLVALLTSQNQNELTHDLWLRLLRRWSMADPKTAATWAESLPASDKRNEATRYVAINWANVDLQAAQSWVEGWSEGAERDSALTAVAYEGARTNPTAALKIAVTLPQNQDNDNLLSYSASQWATRDPVAALKWARQIDDPDTQASLVMNIAVTWASRDPAAAAQVVSSIPAGRNQDDAIVGIAQRWVQHDPVAAKRWVMQLPNHDGVRDTALQAMEAIQRYTAIKH